MNFYTVAIEGMAKLLENSSGSLAGFNRSSYANTFQRFVDEHTVTFTAIENGYKQVVDKEQFLTNMAEAVAQYAEDCLKETKKKSAADKRMMDFNLTMAVYVLPAVGESGYESAKPLQEKLITAWKAHFPKSNLSISDFKSINEGFQHKWCYITTAVCETFHKPDDCYELNLFRNYRDTYLASREDGEEIIKEYYDLAPTIVKHINRKQDSQKIYRGIWNEYLNPCIRMIEQGQNEACMDLYIEMVRDMQAKYFH